MTLVLKRRVGESVIIDAGIGKLIKVVVIEQVNGGKKFMRLGFDCDQSIVVHREEIWKEIQAGAPDRKRERVAELKDKKEVRDAI
jgi:carbon storage regulator CsrA